MILTVSPGWANHEPVDILSGLRRSNSAMEIPARSAIEATPSPSCTTRVLPSVASEEAGVLASVAGACELLLASLAAGAEETSEAEEAAALVLVDVL